MPNGNEIFKLKGGSEVYVFRYQDEWALLTPASDKQQWINFRYLCGFAGCYTPPIVYRNTKGAWITSNLFTQFNNMSLKDIAIPRLEAYLLTLVLQEAIVKRPIVLVIVHLEHIVLGRGGGHYCLNSTGSKRYLPR